jgi:hypothetical protein
MELGLDWLAPSRGREGEFKAFGAFFCEDGGAFRHPTLMRGARRLALMYAEMVRLEDHGSGIQPDPG